MALPGIARGVGRNWPLLLFIALVGYLLSRFGEAPDGLGAAASADGDAAAPVPT